MANLSPTKRLEQQRRRRQAGYALLFLVVVGIPLGGWYYNKKSNATAKTQSEIEQGENQDEGASAPAQPTGAAAPASAPKASTEALKAVEGAPASEEKEEAQSKAKAVPVTTWAPEVIQPRATLWELSKRLGYTSGSWAGINEILGHNPEVKNPHRIFAGQQIVLPSVPITTKPEPQPSVVINVRQGMSIAAVQTIATQTLGLPVSFAQIAGQNPACYGIATNGRYFVLIGTLVVKTDELHKRAKLPLVRTARAPIASSDALRAAPTSSPATPPTAAPDMERAAELQPRQSPEELIADLPPPPAGIPMAEWIRARCPNDSNLPGCPASAISDTIGTPPPQEVLAVRCVNYPAAEGC